MIDHVLNKDRLERDDLAYLLRLSEPTALAGLFQRAYDTKLRFVGNKAYYRGLIEFSNECVKNCFYCGIRSGNSGIRRFRMTLPEILSMAQWAHDNNYGSVTLQSGERRDKDFTAFVGAAVRGIKQIGGGRLGLTLCVGEQTEATYRQWFQEGAHRYLLRIETSNPALYQSIHPRDGEHDFERRVHCLGTLKKIGYQVGTGVLIGVPGQTAEDLADDLLFFQQQDIAMIGMGPYVVHRDTPMGKYAAENALDTAESRRNRFLLGLKMVAAARLFLKDVNIAATTALQALEPTGREQALKAGANILMPIVTLTKHQKDYQLYDNKPGQGDDAAERKANLTRRVESVGDTVGFGDWGDSPHFRKNNGLGLGKLL